MASGTRLAKEKDTKRDDSSAAASWICMPAVAILLEEHRQSALSVGLRSAFASLEAELHTVQATVSEYGEQIVSLETNGTYPGPQSIILCFIRGLC